MGDTVDQFGNGLSQQSLRPFYDREEEPMKEEKRIFGRWDTHKELLQAHNEWIAKARLDGWKLNQYRSSRDHVWLEKDGWIATVPVRKEEPTIYVAEYNLICIWAEDGLQISNELMYPYNFENIQKGLKFCMNCAKEVEKTVRIGFAGRVCPECREILGPVIEKPGWYD